MLSNAPLYPKAFKRHLWRNLDDDLRPSRLATTMARGGTVEPGEVDVDEMTRRQPWQLDLPFRVHESAAVAEDH